MERGAQIERRSSAAVDGIPPPGSRSAAEIRRDIVQQRQELGRSIGALRGRVNELTDVRRQIRKHRTELLAGAAIAGFLIGGAIALRRRNGD
jgi:hypothetical protein